MLHPQCPYCERVNPPDSKFCNACGAPLHLLPCSHCGAVNDATATKCYQCGAALPEGKGSGFGASSSSSHPSVAVGSAGATAAKGSPEVDTLDRDADVFATLQELRQRLAQIEGGTEGRGVDRGNVDSPAPDLEPEMSVAPRTYAKPFYPTRAVTLPAPPTPGRPFALSRNAGMVIGTAVLAAVVAASYYAFNQRQIVDASKPPAAASEGNGDGAPAQAVPPPASETTSAVPAGPGPGAAPPPTVTPGVASSSQLIPRTAAASVAPTQQERASRPAGTPQREGRVTSATPAAAGSTRSRAPETSTGIERPPPARIGPCTDAVAALGLCTPELTQRRE